MDGITRRSFLKLCAAAPMVASSLVFADINEELKPGVRHIGNVRETIINDIGGADYIVSYDVLCGKRDGNTIVLNAQYAVNVRVKSLDNIEATRKDAIKVLTKDIKEEKVDFSTIMPFDFKLGDTVIKEKLSRYKSG